MFTLLLPSIGFFLAYILIVWLYTSEVKKLSIKRPKSSPFYAEAMAELDEIDRESGLTVEKSESFFTRVNEPAVFGDAEVLPLIATLNKKNDALLVDLASLRGKVMVLEPGHELTYLPFKDQETCPDCMGQRKRQTHKARYATSSGGPR